MSRIYDNWARLVKAALLREELRELARADSMSSASSDFSFSSSLHDHVPVTLRGPEAPSGPSIPFYHRESIIDNRTTRKRAFKRKAVVVDSKYADKTWKILEHAIHEIYNHGNSGLNFEKLYRNAYNMVFRGFGEKLYSGLVSTMSFHLQEMRKCLEAADGFSFLGELITKWTNHNEALLNIRAIVLYMDKIFVPSTHKTPILELGLNLWRDNVIHSGEIQSRLLNTLLLLMLEERDGARIDRKGMRNVIKMLMDLGPSAYQEDLEKSFLELLAVFCRAESQKFVKGTYGGGHLKKVKRLLNEEIMRVSHYLDAKSEAKISEVVEEEMIANHRLQLLHMENLGCVKMLLDDKYEDVGRMSSLFRRVPGGLSRIRDVMTSNIRDTGKQLVTDPEKLKNPVNL